MKTKESAKVAKNLTDLTFRTYYTYRDDTREAGDIAVGTHAFSVLAKIYYSETPYCVNNLSELMHMHNPQLSKLLTLLEKEGLVSRSRPAENRRSVLINITDEGKEYFEKMYAVVERRIAETLDEKDVTDPAGLAKAIGQIYSVLYL